MASLADSLASCGLISWDRGRGGQPPGMVRSGKLLIPSHLVAFRLISVVSTGATGAGMRGSRLRGNDGGVAKSGETLIPFHFVPFLIFYAGRDARYRPSRGLWMPLAPAPERPHPMLRIDLSSIRREVGYPPSCERRLVFDKTTYANYSRAEEGSGAMGFCRDSDKGA